MKSSRQAIAVLLLLTSALWLTAAAAPAAPPGSLHVPAEDDWWLPDWVQPVPNSGVYGAHNAPPGFVDVEGVVLPWRMIEPREGVYDWSLLTIRVTPDKAWGTEHPDEVIRNADGLRACAPTDYVGKFTAIRMRWTLRTAASGGIPPGKAKCGARIWSGCSRASRSM